MGRLGGEHRAGDCPGHARPGTLEQGMKAEQVGRLGSVRVAGEDASLADGVLPKPLTLEELGEIAHRLAQGRPLPRP